LVTAGVAFVVKGIIIPTALHRIVRRLGIHREIEQVIGAGPTMLTGLGLVAGQDALVAARIEIVAVDDGGRRVGPALRLAPGDGVTCAACSTVREYAVAPVGT
jgi:hypothetical protein